MSLKDEIKQVIAQTRSNLLALEQKIDQLVEPEDVPVDPAEDGASE